MYQSESFLRKLQMTQHGFGVLIIRTIRDRPGALKHSEASNESPDYPKNPAKGRHWRSGKRRWRAKHEQKQKRPLRKHARLVAKSLWPCCLHSRREAALPTANACCHAADARQYIAKRHGLFAVVLFQNYKHQDLANLYIY